MVLDTSENKSQQKSKVWSTKKEKKKREPFERKVSFKKQKMFPE